MVKPSLEEYLKQNFDKGIIDHAIRANKDGDGSITFYIHPNGFSGDTLDYAVNGDEIMPMYSHFKYVSKELRNASSIVITVKCAECGKQYKVMANGAIPICHGQYMQEKEAI